MNPSAEPLILAIETSCDETAAALVRGRSVVGQSIYSQIDIHKRYGGVVPEIASRNHVEALDGVIDAALTDADALLTDVDAVAVTYGPGLVGALLCGVSHAKALAYALNKPLIPVNHIVGHVSACYLTDTNLEPPFMCLVASGGHSHIVFCGAEGMRVVGRTADDAAGECFDKCARLLGIPYPGGPLLDALAEDGDPSAVKLPRARMEGYNLSFSGLKTAVAQALERERRAGHTIDTADWAASIRAAIVEPLTEKLIEAAKEHGVDTVAVAGGVAANAYLRRLLCANARKNGLKVVIPPASLCTDNAAMIGCAAGMLYPSGAFAGLNLNAQPGLRLAP